MLFLRSLSRLFPLFHSFFLRHTHSLALYIAGLLFLIGSRSTRWRTIVKQRAKHVYGFFVLTPISRLSQSSLGCMIDFCRMHQRFVLRDLNYKNQFIKVESTIDSAVCCPRIIRSRVWSISLVTMHPVINPLSMRNRWIATKLHSDGAISATYFMTTWREKRRKYDALLDDTHSWVSKERKKTLHEYIYIKTPSLHLSNKTLYITLRTENGFII